MTRITTLVPNLPARPPRGAEPLAAIFLAALRFSARAAATVLDGLRSRHLLVDAGADAAHASPACRDGIGSIKG